MNERCPFLAQLCEGLSRPKTAGQGLLLAVSGGADSMAMLQGTLSVADTFHFERIVVAHLNHGLRGDESDEDADFVRQVCLHAGVNHISEALPSDLLKHSTRGSLEEVARAARYDFLHRTALSQNLSMVATAHHQQDQTETVLFSLLRGTGFRGLSGIPEVRNLGSKVKIIRPMLRIEKDIVREYIRTNSVAYRDDSSNETAEFTRNRIRLLMKQLPSDQSRVMEAQLLELSKQATATLIAMDHAAEFILRGACQELSAETARLDRRKLLAWPEPLVRHSLILLWTQQHWPRQQMNTAQWQRLSAAAVSGTPRRWSFPGGVRLVIKRSMLVLERIPMSPQN